jgi:hypothetical protein
MSSLKAGSLSKTYLNRNTKNMTVSSLSKPSANADIDTLQLMKDEQQAMMQRLNFILEDVNLGSTPSVGILTKSLFTVERRRSM